METNQVTKTWRKIKRQILEGKLSATNRVLASSTAEGRSMVTKSAMQRRTFSLSRTCIEMKKSDRQCCKSHQQSMCDTSPFAGMENIHILPSNI
jgi:hypothetical protein